jgi:hypothetical protein
LNSTKPATFCGSHSIANTTNPNQRLKRSGSHATNTVWREKLKISCALNQDTDEQVIGQATASATVVDHDSEVSRLR